MSGANFYQNKSPFFSPELQNDAGSRNQYSGQNSASKADVYSSVGSSTNYNVKVPDLINLTN
jgi:hypothetical protein